MTYFGRIRKSQDPFTDALEQVRAERAKREAEAALRLAEERGEETRETCKTLPGFVRTFWPVLEPGIRLKWGWALDAVSDHVTGITDGHITRLLINVPPATMKSLLTSVFWPAWEWTEESRAHLRYLGTSHDQDISARDADRMRTIVTSPLYRALYPHIVLRRDKSAKANFENTRTGFRQASAFNSMTGKRGNRVIVDDPHKIKGLKEGVSGEDEGTRKRNVETFKSALPLRVNDLDLDAFLIIMQRVHQGDISGEIIEHYPEYTKLILPMEYEPKRHCVTMIGPRRFEDPRTIEGELLMPERFSRETVEVLKRGLGTNGTAAQLQQRPSPAGGGMIKGAWFRRFRFDGIPVMLSRAIYADTASKKGERNDYSVFEVWGSGVDGCLYLLDLVRGKWESPALKRVARDVWKKHSSVTDYNLGPLVGMWVEDKSSGTGLVQELAKADPMQNETAIPVLPIPRSTDKVQRVNDATPSIEAGLVYIPAEGEVDWVAGFIEECEAFTADMTHLRDDQIDPMCDAIARGCYLDMTSPRVLNGEG